MEKLELKHLAPYFPYGMECITTTGVRGKMIMLSDNEVFLDCEVKWNSGAPYNWMLSMDVKPILRPMSDANSLIYKEFHNYSESKPFNHDIINIFCFERLETENVSEIDIKYLQYEAFEWLIRNHFDVFSLIESGLAVDMNTL